MLPDPHDTIVALASAPGPGARAIVRLSGGNSLRVAGAVFHAEAPIEPNRRRCYEGEVRLSGIAAALPASLYVWPAPRTYTGQLVVELHTISCPPLLDLLI